MQSIKTTPTTWGSDISYSLWGSLGDSLWGSLRNSLWAMGAE